jgi:serine/threonine-protein kinase
VEPERPPAVAKLTPAPPQPEPETPSPAPDPEPVPKNKPKPSRTKPSAPKPSVAQVAGKGKFTFRVRPFATVIVNGKNLGQTPFPPVELPAGTYQVQFINEDLKKNLIQRHELKAGEDKIIKLNLED